MTTHSPTRRNVLRGIVVGGCALWLQRGLGAENAPAKLAKAQAQYQDQPKGEQNCAGCMHFLPDTNACKLVEGQISPNGWCILWAKKPAS